MKDPWDNEEQAENWWENTERFSADFELPELDGCPLMTSGLGEALNLGLSRLVWQRGLRLALAIHSLSQEERETLLGRALRHETWRKIGRRLGRDHKTIKARYETALVKLRHSGNQGADTSPPEPV